MRLKPGSRAFLEAAERGGFELLTLELLRHVRATFRAPSGGTVLAFFPATPSDHRGARNFVSSLRRSERRPIAY